jgi:predicted nuclease with TOPRIM domain
MFNFFRNLRFTVEMIHEAVIELYKDNQSLLVQLNKKVDKLMTQVEEFQNDLNTIKDAVSVIGVGVKKIKGETEATLSRVGRLEAEVADLKIQLDKEGIELPPSLLETVANIKAGLQGTAATVAEVDGLIPDAEPAPEPVAEE